MKILIVDDDPTNRKLLQTMLEDLGLCDTAVNGQEAVDCFKRSITAKEYYDVIFLDIKMPVMDGHETLQHIRRLETENDILIGDGAKVVMVTALGDKKNVLSAFQEGCEYYLVKPFQQSRIFELLQEMGYAVDDP
jgi:two-component system, chemotaxis family, chemotaxis protein CheY